MLPLIPWVVSTIAGAIGWKLGAMVGPWTGAVLALLGTGLGGYYGRKIRQSVTP